MSTNKAGLDIKGGIAILKFDNPPVNSLGLELRQAIVEGIERANADPQVEAIVLLGAGAGFSGGADIREFGTPRASSTTIAIGLNFFSRLNARPADTMVCACARVIAAMSESLPDNVKSTETVRPDRH